MTVWAQDPDFPTLIERLERYSLAVLATLAHHDACGRGTVPVSAAKAIRAASVDPDTENDYPSTAGARVVLQVRYVDALDLDG